MITRALGRVAVGSKLFLAEGQSEAGFIERILLNTGHDDAIVYCFEGIERVGTVLKSLNDVPGFSKLRFLGMMLDAEVSFSARVQSIIHHFSNFGVALPIDNVRNARIYADGPCPIGIFISPGAGRDGRIEDIAMDEIRSSPFWACLEAYADCIRAKSSNSLDNKSLVQAYISSIKGSLCGVGRAFQASVLDVNHQAYNQPRELIQALVNVVSPTSIGSSPTVKPAGSRP
jgi:hypothetical protein